MPHLHCIIRDSLEAAALMLLGRRGRDDLRDSQHASATTPAAFAFLLTDGSMSYQLTAAPLLPS